MIAEDANKLTHKALNDADALDIIFNNIDKKIKSAAVSGQFYCIIQLKDNEAKYVNDVIHNYTYLGYECNSFNHHEPSLSFNGNSKLKVDYIDIFICWEDKD